jgi:endonuclease YncB( thermonuclease family)
VLINKIDINLEQIKLGMAWYYKKYKGELEQEDRISYVQAEQEAKKGKLGLWLDENPVPPWDFRKQKKSE